MFQLNVVTCLHRRHPTHFTPAARRPMLKACVDALALPYFLAGLLVPHATLLYWASNSGFQYGLQRALAQPRVAAALKLKSPLTEAKNAQEATGGGVAGSVRVEGRRLVD
jgi:hypothetical protein